VDAFKDIHVLEMRKYPERRIVLIIDFDNDLGRLESIKCQIPEELIDRVFVLGVLSEPEELKANLNYKGWKRLECLYLKIVLIISQGLGWGTQCLNITRLH